jgi:uncharacterized alpha-E superfamily protein
VRFLLADDQFPRSCVCCLMRTERVLERLPNSEGLLRRVGRVRRALSGTLTHELTTEELHGFIDRLQLALARINDDLAKTYFSAELPLARQAAAPAPAATSQSQSQSSAAPARIAELADSRS